MLLAGFWGAKPLAPQKACGRGMDLAGILSSALLARGGFRTKAGVDVTSLASFFVSPAAGGLRCCSRPGLAKMLVGHPSKKRPWDGTQISKDPCVAPK